MMNDFIKNPFIRDYTNILEKETNNMLEFIGLNKEYLNVQLKGISTIKKDETLNNIETKLNNTLKALDDYKNNFETFKISDEIKIFLKNYVEEIILPQHQDIKKILDDKTKNLVLVNLNQN